MTYSPSTIAPLNGVTPRRISLGATWIAHVHLAGSALALRSTARRTGAAGAL